MEAENARNDADAPARDEQPGIVRLGSVRKLTNHGPNGSESDGGTISHNTYKNPLDGT